jgi:hypothetical protein
MSGFPQELVFVLVFGAIMLGQFLYRQWRGRAALGPQAREQAQAQAQAQAQLESEAAALQSRAQARLAQTDGSDPPQIVLVPRAAVAAPAPNVLLQRQLQPPRRFSRQGLMADRRAVQDAIVINAILQPCHAQRPYNVD